MDSGGTAKPKLSEHEPPKHAEPTNAVGPHQWLDRCYAQWKRQNSWSLQATLVLVWLPAAFFILRNALSGKLPSQVTFELISISSWVQFLTPFVNMLISLTVATAAASCFRYEAEVLMASSRGEAYAALRKSIRKTAYKWVFGLMFFPCFIAQAMWLSPMLFNRAMSGQISAIAFSSLLNSGVLFTVFCWCGAELVQYVSLRLGAWRTSWRVLAVVSTALVYSAVMLVLTFTGIHFEPETPWTYTAFAWALFPILPVAAPIYMVMATRRPSTSMLERL